MSDGQNLPPLPKGLTLGQFAAWLEQAAAILDPLPTEDDGEEISEMEIGQALRKWIGEVGKLSDGG